MKKLLVNIRNRNSRPEVFLGKDIPKICNKFTGQHLCRSVISIQLLCIFIEIKLRDVCSPVNLLHIFRTPFLKNTSGRLLLSEAVRYSHNVCSEKFYKFPDKKPKAVAQRYSVKKVFLEVSQN